MEKRNYDEWLVNFRSSIANYKYYVDFDIVYENVEKFKVELNILNSLIGSKNIEKEFIRIINEYPKTLKCIPFLLAVRRLEILAQDEDMQYIYKFGQMNYAPEQYVVLMRETGLFDLLENHLVDKVFAFIAPKIIGGREALTSVEGDGFSDLNKAINLKNITTEMIGEDILISGIVCNDNF